MKLINEINEAKAYLNEAKVLISIFGKRKSFFCLKKEMIFINNDQLNCYIDYEEFEKLFENQDFYLYEDEKDDFVSLEKDREYYSIKHK